MITEQQSQSAQTTFSATKLYNRAFYPWLIWALGASFFFSEYFAHVSLSVMVPDLMKAFHVGALSIGSLSAFFWYSYVFMQVPVGALMDRYSPRRLLMIAAALCAGSCFLFGSAQTLWVANLSRFLMGFTSSFAFVGTLKLVTVWFSPRRLGFLTGLTQAIGMLGAVVGEGPVALSVAAIGWRGSMWVMGGVLLLLALLIGLLMREHPKKSVREAHRVSSVRELWHGFLVVLRNPQSWVNGLFVGLLFCPTAVFGELWGPSYFFNVYKLSPELSATVVGFIFIGWTVGGPLAGRWSDYLKRRRPILLASALMSLLVLSLILYLPQMPLPALFFLCFLFGVSNTGVGVSYAVAAEINPQSVAGTSMAFANMASVIIGAGFQPLIGWLLELQWDHRMFHHAPIYAAHAYKVAMFTLPASLLLAFFIAFFVKETHCHPYAESEK